MLKTAQGTTAASARIRQWLIRPADTRRERLAGALKVSPLLAQVLINRGITDTAAGSGFLRPKLADLIAPEQLPGVNDAVRRIKSALINSEKITVYGDYDVDGITGVAILWQILTLLGANVDYYIPHRIDEGYGLNDEAVRYITDAGARLLITVDCGITAYSSAALARKLRLDLIITDHHQPGPEMPHALAIVHPAADKSYPNQDASGSLVAFKLGWAIANQFKTGAKLSPEIRDFMINATSLAAMGTIADVMDLRGENRIIASFGLKSLPGCTLAGIQAVIESAGLIGKGLDSFDIGFRLAPMLNAAGRMGHARLAVELLTSDSPSRCTEIADYLKEQNTQRQRVERKIFKQACEMIVGQNLNHPDRRTIVLADENWHTGVIGIVAARIVDKFYRPTILFNAANGVAQGSARSIDGFDILAAITACSKHLTTFGGHKKAAGITIEREKIPHFADNIETWAAKNLDRPTSAAPLLIDALVPLSEFAYETVNELQLLGPFGQGNPEPLFATKGVRLCSPPRRVGATGDHLQLAVTDSTNSIRCIGFGLGKLEKKLLERDSFNIAYHAAINNFNGNSSTQLVIEDVQFE
jgi:single-stranded-DNA-specific exonuclease